MFDSIRVKRDLPLPDEVKHLDIDWQAIEYQTKCFDNCLNEYIIDEDGRLYENVIEREYIPYTDEERKSKDRRPWDLWKEINIKKHELVPQEDYHGAVQFYCYEEYDADYSFSIDFNAYYSYGKLDDIKFVEFKKYKQNTDYIKDIHRERESIKYKVKYFLKKYTGWSFACRKLEINIYYIANFLHKIRMFLINIGQHIILPNRANIEYIKGEKENTK